MDRMQLKIGIQNTIILVKTLILRELLHGRSTINNKTNL